MTARANVNDVEHDQHRSRMQRVVNIVQGTGAKIMRNKLKLIMFMVTLATIAAAAHAAHTRGYLPTMPRLEREAEAMLRGRMTSNQNILRTLRAVELDQQVLTKMGHRIPTDLCKLTKNLCVNGVLPRSRMPQVPIADIATYAKKAGLLVTTETLPAGILKPVQTELLTDKVMKIFRGYHSGVYSTNTTPLLVAKVGDKYSVLDGHHRWAGALVLGGNSKVRATVLEVPGATSIMSALGHALAHPGTTFQSLVK